jgi:hypothetical protein
MSLPDAWIDRIFNRLGAVYGARFTSQFGHEAARSAWAHELRRFAQDWPALQHALDHLPADGVPNALQFRDLAQTGKKAPQSSQNEPAYTRASPEVVQRLLGPIRGLPGHSVDRHAWAKRILARETAGDRTLTIAQKRMAHDALCLFRTEPQSPYESTP